MPTPPPENCPSPRRYARLAPIVTSGWHRALLCGPVLPRPSSKALWEENRLVGSGATGHPRLALVYTDFSCVFAGRPGVEPGLQRPSPRVPPQALWFLASCWRQQLPFCLRRVCLLLSACCWPLCIPPHPSSSMWALLLRQRLDCWPRPCLASANAQPSLPGLPADAGASGCRS